MSEDTATAFHEAGHFVAARMVRTTPDVLSIIPTDDSLGHMRDPVTIGEDDAVRQLRESGYSDKAWDKYCYHAFIYAAGAVAEELFRKDGDPFPHGTDAERMEALGIALTGNEHDASDCTSEIVDNTAFLFEVTEVRSAIKHVATVLLQRREITRADGLFELAFEIDEILPQDMISHRFDSIVEAALQRVRVSEGVIL